MSLTNEITLDQYDRFKSMSVNDIALHEMGELSAESVKLAHRWFNRCRAIENKLASENRARNLETLKQEPRYITAAIERQEVAHYEG
jgi:hypothetical protein